MRNQYAPRHAKMRAGGSVHVIPESSSKRHAGGSAAPRILAVTLTLASLGAGAAVLSGPGSVGQAGAPQQVGHASLAVSTSPTGTTFRPDVAWMF